MPLPRVCAPKRPPIFTTDDRGAPVAVILLASGESARLDAHDWERLLLRGVTPNWTLNTTARGHAYVRAQRSRGNLVMVAREVLDARPGEIITYRNGDRTDLRRSNLQIAKGGRAKATDQSPNQTRPRHDH